MGSKLAVAAWCVTLAALVGSVSQAQEVGPAVALDGANPQPPVTAYNGTFTYSIPIEIPSFRGLEPKLALSYDSARGIRNTASAGGWLGVGWTLQGASAIERVSGEANPNVSGGRGSPGLWRCRHAG